MHLSYNSSLIRKIFWIFFLIIAMAFVQGMQLHLHVYAHDPVTSEHIHQAQAHFQCDTAEAGCHAGVVEVELSHEGLLKPLFLGLLVIALFVIVVILPSSRFLSRVPWPPDRCNPLASSLFRLRPPMRAPPR